jgi:hypothetical protein
VGMNPDAPGSQSKFRLVVWNSPGPPVSHAR